jgi:tripartite-type tricarboxylate transporter receptor subunit TctC
MNQDVRDESCREPDVKKTPQRPHPRRHRHSTKDIAMNRGLLSCIVLFLAATVSAAASEFPDRPIRLIIPFSAGGPTDAAARLIAAPLQHQLGQPLILENMPGGSGVPGVASVVAGANDGYTLVVGGIAPIVLVPAAKKLPYDVQKDLVPLGLIWRNGQTLVVRPSLGLNSVAAFVAYAKSKPGQVTVGSAGVGTVSHLANELLQREAGIRLLHIPYHSTSNSVVDLMGGQIDALFGDVVNLKPQIQSGAIKALAVTSAHRSLLLPDVPTMVEAGWPNVQIEVWYGLFAPARTPTPALDKLKAAVQAAQQDPAYVASLRNYGIEIGGAGSSAFAAYIKSQTARWSPIVKALGITFE